MVPRFPDPAGPPLVPIVPVQVEASLLITPGTSLKSTFPVQVLPNWLLMTPVLPVKTTPVSYPTSPIQWPTRSVLLKNQPLLMVPALAITSPVQRTDPNDDPLLITPPPSLVTSPTQCEDPK